MTKIAAPPFEPEIKAEVRNLYTEGGHGTMRYACRWSGVDETTFSKQLSPRQPDYHPIVFLFLQELYGDRRADLHFQGSNIVRGKLALINRVVKGWEDEESEPQAQGGERKQLKDAVAEAIAGFIKASQDLPEAEQLEAAEALAEAAVAYRDSLKFNDNGIGLRTKESSV